MQLKQLEWLDNVSNGVIVASHCMIRVYSSIKIEFQINHDKDENTYYLYSFGIGSVRRLQPDVFKTVDQAKIAAYEIYSNELHRMKKSINRFFYEGGKII